MPLINWIQLIKLPHVNKILEERFLDFLDDLLTKTDTYDDNFAKKDENTTQKLKFHFCAEYKRPSNP